jgi:precorrin-6y C5,15-methyltransferase (decarboxylating) CbiE subunit
MKKIVVAGVGPGGEDYILPVVHRLAAEADVLAGGERALFPFRSLGKKLLPVTADLEALVIALRERPPDCRVVVLVSGDAGFYSLLGVLRRHFPARELDVYPGISAVQVAFARLGEPWHDAVLLSAHGRDGAALLPGLLAPGRKAILTDRKWTPGRLAALLLSAGGRDASVSLCYNLTCPEENIVTTRLSLLAEGEAGDCVMVIHDE